MVVVFGMEGGPEPGSSPTGIRGNIYPDTPACALSLAYSSTATKCTWTLSESASGPLEAAATICKNATHAAGGS
jgi:hypothetical protein